jgi:hypothetical protein
MRCGFVSTLPEQDGQRCERDATLHLLMRHPEHGTHHELLTCSDHYLTAAEAGELVADHPVGWGCGHLDSRWDTDENRCIPNGSGTVS